MKDKFALGMDFSVIFNKIFSLSADDDALDPGRATL